MKLNTTEFFQYHTDRQLLELLVKHTLLNDPSWVNEQLKDQLSEQIMMKWIDFVHANNLWNGNIKVSVCVNTYGDLQYFNAVVGRVALPEPDIDTYMSEVVRPRTRELVNRIEHTVALEDIEIESIEVSRKEDNG